MKHCKIPQTMNWSGWSFIFDYLHWRKRRLVSSNLRYCSNLRANDSNLSPFAVCSFQSLVATSANSKFEKHDTSDTKERKPISSPTICSPNESKMIQIMITATVNAPIVESTSMICYSIDRLSPITKSYETFQLQLSPLLVLLPSKYLQLSLLSRRFWAKTAKYLHAILER